MEGKSSAEIYPHAAWSSQVTWLPPSKPLEETQQLMPLMGIPAEQQREAV